MVNSRVYVIVVTYNGAKWTDKCFGSLVNSSVPLKILAIDNNSSDGTPDIIHERFPDVEVIRSKINLGFGVANNIGLKKVLDENADYALLLNQDAWIEKDTINELLKAFDSKDNKWGILSPLPFDENGEKYDYLFEKFYKRSLTQPGVSKDKTFELAFINAACWLIKLDVVSKLGGFHPKFHMYGEDTNYINRLHYIGEKIGVCFNSKYFHDRSSRKGTHNNKRNRFFRKKNSMKVNLYNPNTNVFKALLINYIGIKQAIPEYILLDILKLAFYNFQCFVVSINKRIINNKL